VDRRIWWSIGLDSLEVDVFDLLVVENLFSKTDSTLLLVAVNRGFKLRLLLLEALVGLATLEILSDQMLVYEMALELSLRDDRAVSKLQVFDEEKSTGKRLIAANAGQPLVDLVILSWLVTVC